MSLPSHPGGNAPDIVRCHARPNPAAIAPNQRQVLKGLGREDLFTVVHEQVLTDTARYADVVLPATTFLEHVELRRKHARDLHRFAMLLGESAISAEMQKRVREMIKTFLERAQAKLENELEIEEQPVPVP